MWAHAGTRSSHKSRHPVCSPTNRPIRDAHHGIPATSAAHSIQRCERAFTPLSEYKIAQDDQSFCGSSGDDPLTEQFTSYSSHNPTVLPNIAFIAWHSGGLQAVDIADARHPTQAGWLSPTPLTSVATEDPALGGGPNKVTMWSYPIISQGLIYVIDIRNGLYILRYTGHHHGEVDAITFLEGNSNLGDARTLDEQ